MKVLPCFLVVGFLVVMKPLKWLLWLSLEIRQRWFLMIMLMLTNILPGSIFLLNMWMT